GAWARAGLPVSSTAPRRRIQERRVMSSAPCRGATEISCGSLVAPWEKRPPPGNLRRGPLAVSRPLAALQARNARAVNPLPWPLLPRFGDEIQRRRGELVLAVEQADQAEAHLSGVAGLDDGGVGPRQQVALQRRVPLAEAA